ncbi:hypothetical protein [Dyella sp. ASV21]|uniref:hypothetical protein n=1 Tax=Dyella sp. ASV21 TaxID=2795114 RepID=UPI0018EE4714|nr:hypothetical protein [Dyella sp. ASV21]
MNIARHAVFLAVALVATTAWAQSADQPLNLKLPAGVAPASSSTAATPNAQDNKGKPVADAPKAQAGPAATAPGYSKDPPGTYYGDTTGATDKDQGVAGAPAVTCDDATYNQPQVHGSVGMGVMSGSHVSGSYTGGAVTVSQAFGSCSHPTGGMSISVSGTQGHFGH